jgi:hypothetical protein
LRKGRTIVEKQSYGYLTFWRQLILVSTILLSGEILAAMLPSQTVHAYVNCLSGPGGHGGLGYGGQDGAMGQVGGDCVIGGRKAFVPGGFNQNNGIQRASQADGGGNIL